MYTYSIIIPHKDTPILLQRCLDSIPSRDDVQVIVVDDKSNPEIVDFEKFPGLNRSNTEVYFDKSGKGAGRARNVGLKHAKGKWLLFADADDMFEDGIEVIFHRLYTEDADIVYFDVISKDSNSLEITNESNYFSSILKKQDEFSLRYCLLTPWMKAIHRSMVEDNHIMFEEVRCGNDTRFSALCGYYATKIAVYDEIGYCWMRRENSLWRNKDVHWYVIRYGVCLRIAKFMRDRGEMKAAELFFSQAISFINNLSCISAYEYIKGHIYYCVAKKERGMLLKETPRLCARLFYFFLKRLGVYFI